MWFSSHARLGVAVLLLYVKCEVTRTALHIYLLLTPQSLHLSLIAETCQYPTLSINVHYWFSSADVQCDVVAVGVCVCVRACVRACVCVCDLCVCVCDLCVIVLILNNDCKILFDVHWLCFHAPHVSAVYCQHHYPFCVQLIAFCRDLEIDFQIQDG